jgi:hypothetical protein
MNKEEKTVIKYVEDRLTGIIEELLKIDTPKERELLWLCVDILYKLRKKGIYEAKQEIKFYDAVLK